MRNYGIVNIQECAAVARCHRSSAPPFRALLFAALLALFSPALAGPLQAQDDIQDQGGPIMQGPITVFLIFWLPNGAVYDTKSGLTPPGIGNYETVMQSFFTNVSGSSYFNVLFQYPGTCGVFTVAQTCLSTVSVGGSFMDTRPYCHGTSTTCAKQAGTSSDPLLDADIQQEVQNIVNANQLTPGLNTEFFVFTGANVQECASPGVCTSNVFCAYHSSFSVAGNPNPFIYAFMPNLNSLGSGCNENISNSPNGQISTDREIVGTSHEFFESVSDPVVNAWVNSGSTEIGDNCNQDVGSLQRNGSNVTFNGLPFVVQEIWSNDDGGCVLAFSPSIPGPTIEYKTNTGGDDLRQDSTATSNLETTGGSVFETVPLKPQGQPKWDNNTTHIRVFQLNNTQPADVAVTLTSHPSTFEGSDNWNIQALDLKLRNPNGTLICEQTMSGNPLARLTGSGPTQTFAMPNCAPPPPPASVNEVHITIETGNDDARSDTELWATFPGEPSICLKPSNNADADGVCPNGGSATDQNGKQSWENWTTSAQSFSLPIPQPIAALSTINIKLLEHNSWLESDDNWDIQSITVTMTDTTGTTTTVLSMSNPRDSHHNDNCMARLRGSPNPSAVTYNLSAANPGGSNLSNPTFGPTPPGSCPQ
ncbi:MAG: hypothetical protein WB780_13265 [Candidatus Acidiferrales bacterium]